MKKSGISALLLLALLLICLARIDTVISGMKKSLLICAFTIVPSLFLFLILSDMIVSILLENEKSLKYLKYVVFFVGALSGFPVGAATCDKLYEKGIISKKDAETILPFCNNTSPAFVIGAIGVTMLNNKSLGLLIYFSQIIAAFIPICFIKIKNYSNDLIYQTGNCFDLFLTSVEKATANILRICSLICVFTSVLSLLENGPAYNFAIVLEVSCGCALASTLFKTFPLVSVGLIGFCCSFSGLCVHMQLLSLTKSLKINYIKLFLFKLLQGGLGAIFSVTGYYLFFYS